MLKKESIEEFVREADEEIFHILAGVLEWKNIRSIYNEAYESNKPYKTASDKILDILLKLAYRIKVFNIENEIKPNFNHKEEMTSVYNAGYEEGKIKSKQDKYYQFIQEILYKLIENGLKSQESEKYLSQEFINGFKQGYLDSIDFELHHI